MKKPKRRRRTPATRLRSREHDAAVIAVIVAERDRAADLTNELLIKLRSAIVVAHFDLSKALDTLDLFRSERLGKAPPEDERALDIQRHEALLGTRVLC